MTKIALIADTHWGIRNDSIHFIDNQKKFLDEVFFPRIDSGNIRDIVHLGDLVDRRKYINFATASRLRTDYLAPIADRALEHYILLGNHDIYWRESTEINAIKELVGDKAHIIDKPETFSFDKKEHNPILMIPWICRENEKEIMDAIRQSKAQVLFAHLELQGFETSRGVVQDTGMDFKLFDKFDLVCTGHYHHRNMSANIHYLGSTGQYTWSDHDDDRGFHIFDTKTRQLEFVRNPFNMFEKVYYDDVGKQKRQALAGEFDHVRGKMVKVIVKSKTNTGWFDDFINKIEKCGPIDVAVVDDHLNLDLVSDASISTEAKDTLTVFREYIAAADNIINTEKLDKFVTELYKEASTVE